jgi:hypothetical protein
MTTTFVDPKRNTPLLKDSLKNLFFPPEQGEYEYFKLAGGNPFAQGTSIVKASWAADAAMLSYARYGTRRMDDNEFERILTEAGLKLLAKIGNDKDNWNAPGTKAFFAAADDFAIMAFRGTEFGDKTDAYADLDILLVHEPDYRASVSPPLSHLSMIEHLFSAPCLVHRGFQGALNQVWGQVHQQLADYRRRRPDAEICITGHSLGGALAVLTYSRCSDRNISAYTFGCPRVGNTAFGKRVLPDANPGKGHFRFVNFDDLVAHVPLESALYRHAPATCYRFDKTGRLELENDDELVQDLAVLGETIGGLPKDLSSHIQGLDQLPAPPGLVDHSPARYCMRLGDCV